MNKKSNPFGPVTDVPRERSVYVAGSLRREDPTLLETMWLVHALGQLGFQNQNIKVLVARADTSSADRALIQGTRDGDRCAFVRLRSPRETLIPVAFGSLPPEREATLHDELEWIGCVGPAPWDEEEFVSRWARACQAMSGATRPERDESWLVSRSRSVMEKLGEHLRRRGFPVRR